MKDKIIENYIKISTQAGSRQDYTQGGGGNTSAKLDDHLMAVKASGYKLKQIDKKTGYVVVDYKKIREYFANVNIEDDKDFEKEHVEYIKSTINEVSGMPILKPSIEAGFHSLLGKYVIHTHSVYANILTCIEDSKKRVNEIFSDYEKADIVWVPYIKPGFTLTLKIMDELKNLDGNKPVVIFMENHGIITSADDSDLCIEVHNNVNDKIVDFFGNLDAFPKAEVKKISDNSYISSNEYLDKFVKENGGLNAFDNILYPDQLVYLNVAISDGKIELADNSKLKYKTGEKEAITMQETALAYAYVVNSIKKLGLTLQTMKEDEIKFIMNWDGEAYRKKLMNK